MTNIKKHQRVNDILLGPLERPALKWLADHLPAWVSPDICTTIGVMGAVVILVSYGLSRNSDNFLWLASLGFVINWFGDSLDGTLARYRHIERPIYGFYIDHMTDAVSQVMIFLGLGLTHYISFEVACLTLIAYLLLSVLVYVRTCVVGEFRISYGKLGPTEIRVLAILLNTVMYFAGRRTIVLTSGFAGPLSISVYDLFVAAIALLLLGFFILTATQETIRLMKANK
ncbi:MAG: CDP-alcohol phosphatidyltransferase family protein [Anaerolineales bacterium]|nr:CDP-alcohol phosphatidyltransferase family protein [Anaerolineales bacterium]